MLAIHYYINTSLINLNNTKGSKKANSIYYALINLLIMLT